MKEKSYLYRFAHLLRGELVFPYDGVVFSRQGVSPKRAINNLLRRIEGEVKIRRPFSYPLAMQLEPTIHCQLDCPYCPRIKATKGMKQGHMKWSNYTRLMGEIGPYIAAIAFWQWGEPLLHPQIVDMIKVAHSYGIISIMSTNAQVNPEDIDLAGLTNSGLDMLIISMDGTTQNTYQDFRAGGQLDRLKNFTSAIIEEKRKSKRDDLIINIRTVATRENEGEIEAVRNFAMEAGADIYSVKSVSLYYEDNPDDPHLPLNKDLRSYQYRGQEEAKKYNLLANRCRKPWTWPTLRYDGTLLFCECDHQMQAKLGNVFSAGSFREVWRGKTAQNLRGHYKANGEIDLDFCKRCRYKLDDAIRYVEKLNDV